MFFYVTSIKCIIKKTIKVVCYFMFLLNWTNDKSSCKASNNQFCDSYLGFFIHRVFMNN